MAGVLWPLTVHAPCLLLAYTLCARREGTRTWSDNDLSLPPEYAISSLLTVVALRLFQSGAAALISPHVYVYGAPGDL